MFAAPSGTLRPRTPIGRTGIALLAIGATWLATACVGTVSDAGGPGGAGKDNGSTGSGNAGSNSGGGGPVIAAPPACGSDSTSARIWRLSDDDYKQAVTDLLPGVTVPDVSTPGR